MGMTNNNLCNSCINIGCEFQSGIVRTKCAFYMPPQLEPDNCGNYVVQESTTKNDLVVDCISRQAVIDVITANCIWENEYNLTSSRIKKAVENLPSVTPQEPIIDKIRAEIAEYGSIMVTYAITDDTKTDKGIEKLVSDVLQQAKEEVLQIIDKHKAESEDK